MSDDAHSRRTAAAAAAVQAARDARAGPGSVELYDEIAEHWLAVEAAIALQAAVNSLRGAGFEITTPGLLRRRVLEAARSDFWARHVIIDGLDGDAQKAAIVGIETALRDLPDLLRDRR